MRRRVVIAGRVQGVAYRAWVKRSADRLGLTGWVRNRRDGCVEAVFSGPDGLLDDMVRRCWFGPPASKVLAVEVLPVGEEAEFVGFDIRPTI